MSEPLQQSESESAPQNQPIDLIARTRTWKPTPWIPKERNDPASAYASDVHCMRYYSDLEKLFDEFERSNNPKLIDNIFKAALEHMERKRHLRRAVETHGALDGHKSLDKTDKPTPYEPFNRNPRPHDETKPFPDCAYPKPICTLGVLFYPASRFLYLWSCYAWFQPLETTPRYPSDPTVATVAQKMLAINDPADQYELCLVLICIILICQKGSRCREILLYDDSALPDLTGAFVKFPRDVIEVYDHFRTQKPLASSAEHSERKKLYTEEIFPDLYNLKNLLGGWEEQWRTLGFTLADRDSKKLFVKDEDGWLLTLSTLFPSDTVNPGNGKAAQLRMTGPNQFVFEGVEPTKKGFFANAQTLLAVIEGSSYGIFPLGHEATIDDILNGEVQSQLVSEAAGNEELRSPLPGDYEDADERVRTFAQDLDGTLFRNGLRDKCNQGVNRWNLAEEYISKVWRSFHTESSSKERYPLIVFEKKGDGSYSCKAQDPEKDSVELSKFW